MGTSASIRGRPGLPMVGTCCAPLLREPITVDQAADLARMLKALADPARLRLVSLVAAREDGEACVCDLTEPLGLTQPTISHHLKIRVGAGIFTVTRPPCGGHLAGGLPVCRSAGCGPDSGLTAAGR